MRDDDDQIASQEGDGTLTTQGDDTVQENTGSGDDTLTAGEDTGQLGDDELDANRGGEDDELEQVEEHQELAEEDLDARHEADRHPPHGSMEAANMGLQTDESGHVDSTRHVHNPGSSGSRA